MDNVYNASGHIMYYYLLYSMTKRADGGDCSDLSCWKKKTDGRKTRVLLVVNFNKDSSAYLHTHTHTYIHNIIYRLLLIPILYILPITHSVPMACIHGKT